MKEDIDVQPDLICNFRFHLDKKSFDYQKKIITLHNHKKNNKLLKKIYKGNFYLISHTNREAINGLYKFYDYHQIKRGFQNKDLIGMSIYCYEDNQTYYITRGRNYGDIKIIKSQEIKTKINYSNSNKDTMDNHKESKLKKILNICSSQKENLKNMNDECLRLKTQLDFKSDECNNLTAVIDELEIVKNDLLADLNETEQQRDILAEKVKDLETKVNIYEDEYNQIYNGLDDAYEKIVSNRLYMNFKVNEFIIEDDVGILCVFCDTSNDRFKLNDKVFKVPYDSDYEIQIIGKDSNNFILHFKSDNNKTRSQKIYKGRLSKDSTFYVEYTGSMKLPNSDNSIEISYGI